MGKNMKTVWLDLETTGLDTINDTVLELAVAVQDDPYDSPYPLSFLRRFKGGIENDFVHEMHTKNGLLADCRGATGTLADIESFLLTHMLDDKQYQLAGASVHFDLTFLLHHMPALAAKFSHRLLDTTAIGLFAESMGMPKMPRGAGTHRAADDILECHGKLVAIRDWFAKGGLRGA